MPCYIVLSSSRDGHSRVILSKVMTSGYKHIRLFATQHLGNILKNEKTDSNDWAIQLLCTQVSDKFTFPRFLDQDYDSQFNTSLFILSQLCDPSTDVSHMAVRTLDEACSCRENLDTLIRLRPSLDHLGEAGNPLMFRFLSTSVGFQHLSDMSYIEGEMDDWFMVCVTDVWFGVIAVSPAELNAPFSSGYSLVIANT